MLVVLLLLVALAHTSVSLKLHILNHLLRAVGVDNWLGVGSLIGGGSVLRSFRLLFFELFLDLSAGLIDLVNQMSHVLHALIHVFIALALSVSCVELHGTVRLVIELVKQGQEGMWAVCSCGLPTISI